MNPSAGTPPSSIDARPDNGTQYALHSDLARLCLPGEYKDSNRRLAWINSICALFLAIGIVGLKGQRIIKKELSNPDEFVPIIFTQPEEVPQNQPEPKPDEPPPLANPLDESPVVATVVVANSPSVAFAVPVKGATILAPARFAAPPPPQSDRPTAKVTRFVPGAGDRSTPQPEYPLLAQKRGYEGTATINFVVNEAGGVTKAEVAVSSGFTVLDDAALNVVKNRWRFPAGEIRYHYVEIVFQLQ
jgi:TonB family protein